MIRFFFKQPQHRRFDFKPRYYNESKEKLEARVEAIKREMDHENTAHSELSLRNRMQHSWKKNEVKKSNKTSNRNVLIIAGILMVIAYLLLR